MIYLDNNASTPLRPEALAVLREHANIGNPSSPHRIGARARRVLEDAQDTLKQNLGADSATVICTSGGTESDHLAIRGLAHWMRTQNPQRNEVILSAVEHPAVHLAADSLCNQGFVVRQLPVERTGQIAQSALAQLLSPRVALLSVMLVNNETGALQDLQSVAAQAAQVGCLLHTDAVAAAGKMTIAFDQWGVDALSLSAHKFGGPRGVGALLLRRGLRLQPLWWGGGQQDAIRPGTEAVPLIAAMSEALRLSANEEPKLTVLRNKLRHGLLQLPGARALFATTERVVSNTLSLGFQNYSAAVAAQLFDKHDICVSAGAACHDGDEKPSAVLLAMGVSEAEARCMLRWSLGWQTSEADIDKALLVAHQVTARV